MKSPGLYIRSSSASQLIASLVLVASVWLVAISRWVVSDLVVPWDSKNQFYAFFRYLCAALRAGEWPFWNPYHYGGHPSIADPQSLVFNPVFALWGLLDSAPTMRAFDMLVFAHLLVGGIAIAIIGWRLRWPIPANVLAAALFMFGGAASGRLQHTGIIISYAVFPLALLLLQLALQRRSHLIAAGFAIVAAYVALGRNQVALLLCTLLLAAAMAEILISAEPLSYLRERFGVFVTIAIIGGALLIVPVLLTMQFAMLSNRPTESFEDALKGSLYPADLANLAVANIFGTHQVYWGPGAATLPAVAFTDDSENYLFVGAVSTVLLLWLGFIGGGTWRFGRRLMAMTLVSACLFMLGRYTPFYGLVFTFAPGIDLFRRPTDASFVFGIAFALLVGHCLSDYVREGLPRFRPFVAIVVVSAVVAVAIAAVTFSARTDHAMNAIFESLVAGTIMLLALGVALSARGYRGRLVAASLVSFLAVAELLWWNAASRLNAQSRRSYAVLEEPEGAEKNAIALLEEAMAADHLRGEYPRVEILGLGGAWQNLAIVRGWEAINGYNPLRIGLYDHLVAPGEENWDVTLRRFPPSFANYDSPLAQALGLTYLVLGRPLDQIPALSKLPSAKPMLAGPPIWIYRVAGAMPRAILVPNNDDASTTSARSTGVAEEKSSNVRIEFMKSSYVELVTSSITNGSLILHVNYYPGWIAEVDGQMVPIRRADPFFLSADIPAGRHRVVFRFVPLSLGNLEAASKIRTDPAMP